MSKPHRIVVLGAHGFIGQRIVAALARTGWAAPVAAGHRARSTVPSGVEQLRVDATQPQQLAKALDGADGVVNCVTGSSDTIIAGAQALFETVAALPRHPRVVHLSTMSVYGSATGVVDESAPLRGDVGAYSAAKVAAEQLAAGYDNVAHLRPGIVYGPDSAVWSVLIARLLQAHRLGDLGAGGDGNCNLVHVDDVAAAVVHALETPGLGGRAFNLSLPVPMTWNDYLVRYALALGAVPVSRITGRRLKLERKVLAPPLKALEIVAKKVGLQARLPPLIPPSIIRLFGQDIRLDVKQAEQVLGLTWTPVEQGIAQTAAWIRSHS